MGDLALFLKKDLVLLVNELLFSFDILEHVFVFRNDHVVGEDLGVLIVKLVDLRQSVY